LSIPAVCAADVRFAFVDNAALRGRHVPYLAWGRWSWRPSTRTLVLTMLAPLRL
jgi:hypothetical protein